MHSSIEHILISYNKNAEMLEHIKSFPNWFCKLINTSMDLKHPKAWRAAMIIGHIMKKNDLRVTPHINDFIDCLPHLTHDGHQRQALIILDKLTLNEDQNGHLFNHCLSIWEQVNKIPSTRIRAFQAMIKMTKQFPELKDELKLFTTDYYSQTLSEGIKVTFDSIVKNKL